MSSIKKILLDKKKLKRANVIFYRQNKPGNTMPQLSLMGNHQIKEWIPFTDQEHDMMAKDFANSLVAFKIKAQYDEKELDMDDFKMEIEDEKL